MRGSLSFLNILVPYKVITNGNGTINGWISLSFIACIAIFALIHFRKFYKKTNKIIDAIKDTNNYIFTISKEHDISDNLRARVGHRPRRPHWRVQPYFLHAPARSRVRGFLGGVIAMEKLFL
ncbi:MAG: hypothetical protein GXZ13_06800 [Synergistaceae bacterium]|nr:hypothetical protein [Synergistaceae bacterium]